MPKILLINPLTLPVSFSRQPSEAYPQLGLAYIASYLRARGIGVDLLDAHALKIPYNELKGTILKSGAEIVGITSMTPTIYYALACAKVAKEAGCKVVLGGIHPSVFYDSLIRQPEVDYIVRGEGEQTMLELVQALDEHRNLEAVDGLVFKNDGKVVVNKERKVIQDLDSMPFPAWDLMPVNRYDIVTAVRKPCVTMLISRGCPYKCVHCSSQIIFKRLLRQRSAKNVADEMEMLVKDYGVKFIYFIDYCFTANKNRVMQICDEIKKRNLKVIWWAEGRADTVDKELFSAMKSAGCHSFSFGVESGSQQILDNLQRKMTIDEIRKAVKTAKEVKLHVGTAFMIGSPGENYETALETIKFAIELDADEAQFSIFTPYPGTEFYEIAKQKGLIEENTWQDYDNTLKFANTYFPETISFRSEYLSAEDLKRLYRIGYRKFYLRPRRILRTILYYLSKPVQFKRTIFAFLHLLKIIFTGR